MSEEESEIEDDEESNDESVKTTNVRMNTALRHLTTSYNPNPLEHMEKTELAFIAQEQTALIANFTDGNDDPVNHNQVKYNPDRKEWWKAMCTEFENIEKKNVWQIVEKSKVPANRQVIGNRWVFVKKDDGGF